MGRGKTKEKFGGSYLGCPTSQQLGKSEWGKRPSQKSFDCHTKKKLASRGGVTGGRWNRRRAKEVAKGGFGGRGGKRKN